MNKRKLTTDIFIERSKNKYGNKFSYDKTQYTGQKNRLIITCNLHNYDFEVFPNAHLDKLGACPKCYTEWASQKWLVTKEDWILKCRAVHGDKYDYGLADYKGIDSKVKIVCNLGHVFEQRAGNHNAGVGCPECNKLRLSTVGGWKRSDWKKLQRNRLSKFYVFKLKNEKEVFLKIGRTHKSPEERLSNILSTGKQSYIAETIKIIYSQDSDKIFDLELQVKKDLKNYKYKPNVNFSGKTECYQLTSQVLDYINNL